jgi:hypothetical protein
MPYQGQADNPVPYMHIFAGIWLVQTLYIKYGESDITSLSQYFEKNKA